VLLHHSFGTHGGAAWTPFHADLAADHTVIAPDLPGFGRSDLPDRTRDTRDLAILIGDWIARQDLGPVTLVGPGFGGWIAAYLATTQWTPSPALMGG
jgi:pimeloyl-ACP methyl ester carboxylesterase